MIYTVTLSPSIDYIVRVDKFKTGEINRTYAESYTIGGKGINVSLVLNQLGIGNVAMGFTAGFTGTEIVTELNNRCCKTDFVHLDKGFSRINVKMKSDEETDINGQGPDISESDIHKLYLKLDNLHEGDILVLSGNAPGSLGKDIYEKVLKRVSGKNIKAVVDTSGDLLLNCLKHKPFLIKPNNHELSEIFGVEISIKGQIIDYGKKLIEMGAENVLVSMAENGAVLITKDKIYESGAPKGKMKNSTGAGDSMVAGFIAGFLKNGNFHDALRLGIAAGSATAFSDELADKKDIRNILKQI